MARRGPRGADHLFFYNDTATTEIYTLSLHDALPIFGRDERRLVLREDRLVQPLRRERRDRKSTRLNSSHVAISYAVFCLTKKTTQKRITHLHPKKKNKTHELKPQYQN